MKIKEIIQSAYQPKEYIEGVYCKGEKISRDDNSSMECFDLNGKKQIEFQYKSTFDNITKYTYNEKGQPIEVVLYKDTFDTVILKFYFIYNKYNLLIVDRVNYPDEPNWAQDQTTYQYDNDNRIKIKYLYNLGKLKTYTTFEYEAITNKVIERKYNVDNKILSVKESIYTYFHKLLAVKHYNNENINELHIFKYNEKQQLIEDKVTQAKINYNQTTYYNYDEFDNLIFKKVIDVSFEKITNQEMYYFEYDENNQWVSQKHYKDNKLIEVIERDIEYYKL